MNSKPLGETKVLLPEIGLGTWNYRAGIEPLWAGFEAGAFVDTAESYDTEFVVGQAIATIRKEVFVATKISPGHFRYGDVLKAADASLQRLGTARIDLYQLHEPSLSVPMEETMAAMEKLVDDGKVRFIGVSNFTLDQLKAAQKVMRKYPIVANQVRYNLIDRTIEKELLAYCQKSHITIIAYSPLGRELQRVRDCDTRGILNEVARATGKTVPQVLLNWLLCREGVVAVPKGNSVQHILENCGASGWRLTADHLRQLDAGVQFRRRSPAEQVLRRLVPSSLTPWIKDWVKRLPPVLRRRLN